MTTSNISLEVKFFKDNGFNLWNVNEEKKPCILTKNTKTGITGWQNYSAKDFEKLKVDYTQNIGFYSGYQYKSQLNIIVLDFDIFSKGIKNDEVSKLYEQFLELDLIHNKHKKGHYNSSTCGNKGVLLNITDNSEFIEYLNSFNLAKISGGLEILIKNNVVLPPSITNCKNCEYKPLHPRKFIEDIGYTNITSEIDKFIRNYIDCIKRKKLPTKNTIRDTKNAGSGVIHYSNIVSDNDEENKPSYICILELIKKILKPLLNDYQGWFFITSSLINSYGNNIDNFNLFDTICKSLNGYDYNNNLQFWNTTKVDKYQCYNYKAIIKTAYFYDPLTTYCILGEEYKRIQKLKEENIMNDEYIKWKVEFEKTRSKIISPLNFLDIINGSPDFISQMELKQRYMEKSKFIDMWLKDENKRCYQKIIFKPNATEEENKLNYNLFTGYRIDKLNIPLDSELDIKPFLEFINLISGNKNYKNIDYNDISFKLVMAYIIKIIKYKDRPKISLILRSVRRQGCGKGTFYNLLKAMIGNDYCIETGIINDLFGNFNDARVNKLLIVVDECSGSETFQYTGKVKNAITENTFTANPKYGKKYELDNYNSFIFYSNNERCMNVEIGNRRFWVIDVPNTNDEQFLININKNYIENDKYIKAFYNYILTKAEQDFNINFDTFNFENIVRNNENKSTKNLKQTYAKDLFFIDFYENIILENRTKRLLRTNETDEDSIEDIITYNDKDTICIIKATKLYDEYKYFFTNSNISKDGGSCGSNQAFYKSLEFYDFLKSRKVIGIYNYIVDINKYAEWYEKQEDNNNFEPMTEQELSDLGFYIA